MESTDFFTTSSWAGALLSFLKAKNEKIDEVFSNLQLAPALLKTATTPRTVSLADITKIWGYAHSQYGSTVGLQVAKYYRLHNWSTLGIVLQSSKNIDDFLCRVCQYAALLVSDVVVLRYEPSLIVNTKMRLSTYFTPSVEFEAERTECYLAAGLAFLEMICGNNLKPQQVDLIRPFPDDPSPWYATFGKNIRWEAKASAFYLDEVTICTVIPHVDSELSHLIEKNLLERIEQNKELRLSERIHREICLMLPHGGPSIKKIASHLNMSTRSLQRHLEEEGLQFRSLVEDIQLKTAKDYLSSSKHSLSEIALLTGFSNQGNFSHAFKRWTNMTPNAFRKKILAEKGSQPEPERQPEKKEK